LNRIVNISSKISNLYQYLSHHTLTVANLGCEQDRPRILFLFLERQTATKLCQHATRSTLRGVRYASQGI